MGSSLDDLFMEAFELDDSKRVYNEKIIDLSRDRSLADKLDSLSIERRNQVFEYNVKKVVYYQVDSSMGRNS